MADDQVSPISLILVVVISGLAIRYFFFSSSASSSSSTAAGSRRAGRDSASAARTREAAVERLIQMFPQMDRRTVLWDLQRTGGSVQATTERILAGRVETPPVTFQPPPPPSSPTPSGTQAQAQKAPSRPAEPDLITRYKLQGKVSQDEQGESVEAGKKGWSTNKDERQSALERRRNEMILAARKKMEEKIRAEKAAGSET